jgi:hypothetical protein
MLMETSRTLVNFAFLAPRLISGRKPSRLSGDAPGWNRAQDFRILLPNAFPLGLPSPLVNAALHHVVEIDGAIVAAPECRRQIRIQLLEV